jgi:hypothetical protein
VTAQTLTGAVTAFASVIASVSGVDSSPAYPKFNINERVFALNYVMNSVVELSELGTRQHLATIAGDLLTPILGAEDADIQTMLTIAELAATAFITEMTDAGTKFNGVIDTFENCRIEFLPAYLWNNTPYIGYRVMLENVKLKLDL